MALLLNWVVSSFFILAIKLYQKLLSGKIKMRRCIYAQSCSQHALCEFKKSTNIVKSISYIYSRYTSCKIRDIVCEELNANQWHVINGHGQIIDPSQLSSFTIKNIRKIIYEKIM